MKTMTCRDLGGACDVAHRADNADDIIKAQDQHLKDSLAGGDAIHQHAADAMRARWRNPLKGMGWYRATKRAFADLPED